MSKKIEVLSFSALLDRAGLSQRALYKRALRASRKPGGLMEINGLGWFVVRKPRRDYEFIPLRMDEAAAEKRAHDELLKILRKLSGFVCEDCAQLVGQVIVNAEQ